MATGELDQRGERLPGVAAGLLEPLPDVGGDVAGVERVELHRHGRICRSSLRADAGTRTPDPLLTMEVLYRLSYVGAVARRSA